VLKSGKSLLALSFYVLLGILIVYPALRIGFLGDFAGDLFGSQNNWLNFASYHWNFYVPAMAVYAGLYKIFHLDPRPYQAFHLGLIFLNAWFVYLLAQELKLESWQCRLAGLLALLNSAAFETYFWLSTIPKVLCTSFGLVALIFLSRLRQSPALFWGWGYLIMVTLGLTMESTGLILPLLGVLLDLYYRPWRASGKEKAAIFAGFRLHLFTFSLAGAFLLVRYFLGIRLYAENLPVTQKFLTLARSILNTFFHGLQDRFWFEVKGIPLTSVILVTLLLLILMLTWHVKRGMDHRRFVTLLLLWIGACLPHSLGSHFHSRYLYFPGEFAALVVAEVLGSLRLPGPGRKYVWLLISLAVIGYLSLDCYAIRQSLNSYLEASRIYNNGIKTISSCLPKMPPGARLILVDFPDCIYRPRHIPPGSPRRYRVLVYRNALPCHLALLYQTQNFTLNLLRLSPPSEDNPKPLGTPTSPEQLARLSTAPHTVTCRYFPSHPGNFVIARGTVISDLR
jgi:hypothetical protein